MLLIVGLGNPGSRYAGTRHNVGFMLVDALAHRWGLDAFKDKFQGAIVKGTVAGTELALLKPLTFMNLSGESVQRAMSFFRVPASDILVLHDELDLPFGTLRLKKGGGAAGHNGLRSIMQHCGGPDFARLRIGIGRPTHGPADKYVLSDFTLDEKISLEAYLGDAANAVEEVLRRGLDAAMNSVNAREKGPRAAG